MTQQDGSVNNKVNDCEAAQLFSNPLPGNTETAMTTETTKPKSKYIEDSAAYNPSEQKLDETLMLARDPDEATIVSTTEKDAFYTKQRVLGADGKWTKALFGGGVLDKETGEMIDKRPFQHAKPKVVKLSTVDDIEAMLHGLLDEKKSCVIRGQLVADYLGYKEVRRTNNAHNGVPAYFEAVERTWLMIDIDGDGDMEVMAPAVDGTMAEQATSAAKWAVNEWLPEVFRGCDAVVQWSSSYGLDGRYNRVKAHVWFKIDAPLDGRRLEKLIRKHYSVQVACDGLPFTRYSRLKDDGTPSASYISGDCRLDSSVLRTTQPNFTATPVLRDYAGNTLPDPVAEVRIIRVNKGGPVVSAQTLLNEYMSLVAAKELEVDIKSGRAGKDATPKAPSDKPAPMNRAEWSKKDESDFDKMLEALTYLGENSPEGFPSLAVCYEDWLRIGMAIHSRFPGADGQAAWRDWAKYLPKRDPKVAWARWNSFHQDGGRKIGVVFWEAKARGYGPQVELKPEYTVTTDDGVPAPGVPGVGTPDYGDELPMLELNDRDHALRIKAAWGSKLRFVEDWNNWCIFVDGRWSRLGASKRNEATQVMSAMVSFVVDSLTVEGKRAADLVRTAEFRKALEAGMKDTDAAQIANKAAAATFKRYEAAKTSCHHDDARILTQLSNMKGIYTVASDWDTETDLIGVKNGIVNLRTGELLARHPDRMMLRYANVTYTPELAGSCSVFYKFLCDIMGLQTDTELTPEAQSRADYLRKVIATFLTGEVKARQKFYIWHGTAGANGKSTLITFLNRMLRFCKTSGYAATLQPATIQTSKRAAGGPTSDLIALQGMRLATIPETESQGGRLDMGFIKGVTSGDALSGRPVYGRDQITFEPTCKLVMACNTVPSFASDGGTARRLEVTGFERSFTGDPTSGKPLADVNLPAKLEAEMDAVFATLVQECVELYANGFKIDVPESVRNVTSELNEDMNPVKEFIDQCCVRCDERTPAGPLLGAYNDWCRKMRAPTHTANSFSDQLKRLGFEKKRMTAGQYILGLRLNEMALMSACASPI